MLEDEEDNYVLKNLLFFIGSLGHFDNATSQMFHNTAKIYNYFMMSNRRRVQKDNCMDSYISVIFKIFRMTRESMNLTRTWGNISMIAILFSLGSFRQTNKPVKLWPV